MSMAIAMLPLSAIETSVLTCNLRIFDAIDILQSCSSWMQTSRLFEEIHESNVEFYL